MFIEREIKSFLDGQLPDSLKFSMDLNLLREDRELVSKAALNSLLVLRTRLPGEQAPVVWNMDKAVSRLRSHVDEFPALGLERVPTEFLEIATKQVVLELSERKYLHTLSGDAVKLENVDTCDFVLKTWMADEFSKYTAYLQSVSETRAVDTKSD